MNLHRLSILLVLSCFAVNVSARVGVTNYKNVVISCNIRKLTDSTDIGLRVIGDVYGAHGNEDVSYQNRNDLDKRYKEENYVTKVNNHFFRFTFHNITSAKHVVLYSKNTVANEIIEASFTIEQGDSILITQQNGKLKFSGRNAAKYACEYDLYRIARCPIVYLEPENPTKALIWYHELDSLAIESLKRLDNYKNKISVDNYWLLKGRIISDYQHIKTYYLMWNGGLLGIRSQKFYDSFKSYKSPIWNRKIRLELQTKKSLRHSLNYLEFINEQYKYDSCFLKRKDFNVVKCYAYLTSIYTGPTREWLIYKLVKSNLFVPNQNVLYCINKAISSNFIHNKKIERYFIEIKNTNIPGSPAYNFSLLDTNNQVVHLSDFKGRVVLLDFWFIECGACVKIHPKIDKIRREFKNDNFSLISICIDYTGKDKQRWPAAIANGLRSSNENINLLAEGQKGKDPQVVRHFHITGCPTIILIDKYGKIAEQPVDPRIDDGKNLIQLIKKNL